jgi:hypothetical protein
LNALTLRENSIQQARELPNLEFFEFQCLSGGLQTESDVSFSQRNVQLVTSAPRCTQNVRPESGAGRALVAAG